MGKGVGSRVAAEDDFGVTVTRQVSQSGFSRYAHHIGRPDEGRATTRILPIAAIDVECAVGRGGDQFHQPIPVQVANSDTAHQTDVIKIRVGGGVGHGRVVPYHLGHIAVEAVGVDLEGVDAGCVRARKPVRYAGLRPNLQSGGQGLVAEWVGVSYRTCQHPRRQ
jgi:hypothetical protein